MLKVRTFQGQHRDILTQLLAKRHIQCPLQTTALQRPARWQAVKGDEQQAANMPYDEAEAFCAWLGQNSGLDMRLEVMDRAGIEYVVLSQTGPGVQVEKDVSVAIARELMARLQDFDAQRLEVMDRAGIEYVVLSQTGPGVQVEKDVSGNNQRPIVSK
ncbi:amidohydrolase [Alcaligenes faecalis subsp. faecalis NCIB 8687]|nr:amidohydrolase [Alcaligenes faecalis subsp. faecalis NCIB 8687]